MSIPPSGREGYFDPLFRDSVKQAADLGESLTLVRPTNLRMKWKLKSGAEIATDAARRGQTLRQGSLFDKELAQLQPCPFDIRIEFDDAGGHHDMACSDWETGAAFFNLRTTLGDEGALERLRVTYETQYAAAGGVAVALGTVKKRPQQWLLLGVLRLDETRQPLLI